MENKMHKLLSYVNLLKIFISLIILKNTVHCVGGITATIYDNPYSVLFLASFVCIMFYEVLQ